MKKLSLCVIAGNVEKYIDRFLDCFEPLADEIIVVSAIGCQELDKTASIARARGCVVAHYDNKPSPGCGCEYSDDDSSFVRDCRCVWPHVDDFAAARNMAFDMASHDLIMWADTDDMISPESIAAIRDAIERMSDDCDGIEIPYHVPEDGLTVFRERIIRKGKARWVSPIHEHLQFHEEPKLARLTSAKILHAPTGSRAPNDERNLRVLESIPADERTSSHRFHLFQSLRAVGRIDDAVSEAVSLLSSPPEDIGKAERYELYIAAGQLSPEPSQRAGLMLQAIGVDPSRREAYGELALCYIGLGRPQDALALTKIMRSISRADNPAWNARDKYHGYLGEQLHGMALRANGRIEEADAMETNHFIRSGAKISLLHATRGRVKQAVEARRKWLNKASDPDAIEHIFGLDVDDEHAMFLTVHNHVLLDGTGGPVAAWNAAASKSSGGVLVQMSDDWDPPMHWDKLILDSMCNPETESVLAVNDGHRTDDLLCMAIMTRARYKAQGFMFHPEFFSMYSDNWFSECAWKDGVVIDARDRIMFEHLHPAFGAGEMDETYARSNDQSNYTNGKGTLRRLQEGIRLASDIDGWCDFGTIYQAVADSLPDGATFAEVGSWMGQSAVALLHRIQDSGKTIKLHCIDTFKGAQNESQHLKTVNANGGSVLAKFMENVEAAGVSDMIEIEQGDSAESAELFHDGSLDGVFIDAAHDYDSVVKDLAAWLPKVKTGGFFGGHDIDAPGVRRAVDEAGFPYAVAGRCWIKTNPQP